MTRLTKRAPFGPGYDFVALRQHTFNGAVYNAGQPFPKEQVDARRLMRMYEARQIQPIVPGYPDPRAGAAPDAIVPHDYYEAGKAALLARIAELEAENAALRAKLAGAAASQEPPAPAPEQPPAPEPPAPEAPAAAPENAQDAPEAPEGTSDAPAADNASSGPQTGLRAKHLGFGKWAVVNEAGETVNAGPLTKDEAEAIAAAA